ncbi:MAG TPA: sigma-70 family RNA polymerase sigma factor [Candidatus Limnocylindrales bacterium]|nr:sigma-70 family RNA polymerase sigma factor [Candidatus Limnocylindrales bacterium]
MLNSRKPTKPVTDESLVKRCQAGDSLAFETLVIRYQRQIFSLIHRMTNNPEIVEDLAQEVFISAFKAIGEFKGNSSFFTWLYRIAINKCKNYLASSRGSLIPIGDRRSEAEPSLLEIADQRVNPQTALLTGELLAQVDEALGSLPDDQREALVLYDLEGLSYQEIAEVLNCPIGTVRSRLARARAALRERLKDYFTE